jgi:hypothetical protein
MIPSDGIINSIEVSVTLGGGDILHVTSDGCANFHVVGTRLRWADGVNVTEYETKDDLAVMGQIVHHLGALFSMEVLKAKLDEQSGGRNAFDRTAEDRVTTPATKGEHHEL